MFRSHFGLTDLSRHMFILNKHLIFYFTVSSLPKRCLNLFCLVGFVLLNGKCKNAFIIARYHLAVLKQWE